MSSDRSIVSSAASRGKPQPIRSVGNSIRSHSEQRGSNMCTKGLSISRGCSLAAAALAAAEVDRPLYRAVCRGCIASLSAGFAGGGIFHPSATPQHGIVC